MKKNQIYLAIVEVTKSDGKFWQLIVVNRKTKRLAEKQISELYKPERDRKVKILEIITEKNTSPEMWKIISKFNFFWGKELFDKLGKESYRKYMMDYVLSIAFFLGAKHMREMMLSKLNIKRK